MNVAKTLQHVNKIAVIITELTCVAVGTDLFLIVMATPVLVCLIILL